MRLGRAGEFIIVTPKARGYRYTVPGTIWQLLNEWHDSDREVEIELIVSGIRPQPCFVDADDVALYHPSKLEMAFLNIQEAK